VAGRWIERWGGARACIATAVLVSVVALAATACTTASDSRSTRGEHLRPPSTSSATSTASGTRTSTTSTARGLAAPLPAGDDTTVERVVDGDTLVVRGGVRVRLIGVDTPETKDPRRPVQCFGREASARTAALVPPGTALRLVYDVEREDRYGRTLAYVYRAADGLFLNAALVRDGYAVAATFPPDVAHADEFVALTREARDAGRGLWSACGGPGRPAG
jgi:micrococcal nuclease